VRRSLTRLPVEELRDKLFALNTTDARRPDHDSEVMGHARSYLDRLATDLRQQPTSETFFNFWPPRVIESLRLNRLACFFGAGLSLPSGLPSWAGLLNREFPLDASFVGDPDLESDPLTRAELSSHRLGAEVLQERLRSSMSRPFAPTANHLLTAALRLPVYITTNYDGLFESAWEMMYGEKIATITTAADLDTRELSQAPHRLFKIHGSITRPYEDLIVTRSDYRRHYRFNRALFDAIEGLMCDNDTLFLGFSHKDPEVTRLVEDAIWRWEKLRRDDDELNDQQGARGLNLYSLQFDMKAHTPEIFAARGIVALEPTRELLKSEDVKSAALARSLIDLLAAAEGEIDKTESLDTQLRKYSSSIASALKAALQTLMTHTDQALARLRRSESEGPSPFMQTILQALGMMASQGVYLVDRDGAIIEVAVPAGLTNLDRISGRLGTRPYFRQATTYRVPFVSDAFESKFNGHSTITLCVPLLQNKAFQGLLFAACQVGSWRLPLQSAEAYWAAGLEVLIIDSNGVCLMPPHKEIVAVPSAVKSAMNEPANDTLNVGFPYERLLSLSRRDRLISRLSENVVPLGQDDDVLPMAGDVKVYSVVSELRPARWKVAISKAVPVAKTARRAD
jgi:hypothetical protein